jgi:hypothetical protein
MFDNGDAVTPWAKTLNSTVTKTTERKMLSPGNTFNSCKANKASTIEANPRGPNHPMNKMESKPNLVPINDMATGIIRIIVKLKIA